MYLGFISLIKTIIKHKIVKKMSRRESESGDGKLGSSSFSVDLEHFTEECEINIKNFKQAVQEEVINHIINFITYYDFKLLLNYLCSLKSRGISGILQMQMTNIPLRSFCGVNRIIRAMADNRQEFGSAIQEGRGQGR